MKKHQTYSLLLLALVALFLNACASLTTMQTAAVVPEGEVRWAIAATGTGADGAHVSSSAEPNFEASIRYGIADNVDIGLKLDLLGAQVGAKYQFVSGTFDLSLGIEAGYQWLYSRDTGGDPDDPSTHLIAIQLPLMMEYHFNPYVGLAFGPKLAGLLVLDTDMRSDVWHNYGLYLGMMIGLPLRLTEGVWFQPEFNIYTNLYDESDIYFSTAIWQAGLSVFFGGL